MKIGFFWHSMSSGNLGVRALSYANMLLVQQIADELDIDVEYVMFGPRRKSDVLVEISAALPAFRYISMSFQKLLPWSFYKLLREIDDCDLILDLGAGDSFSDIYGYRRFSKILASKFLARKGKKRLILSPQTIGPFRKLYSKYLAKLALNNVREVYARDQVSYDYCRSLGSSVKVTLSTDVAMGLPYGKINSAQEPLNSDVINVGINVSGLLCSGGYSGNNQFELSVDYLMLISSVIDSFKKLEGVSIWLVPHVYSDTAEKLASEDDREASKKIAALVGGVEVCRTFADPIEAKTFISNLDFFVGSRMHATIAAFSTGVPVVALGYSRKFSGLFGTLRYNYSCDLTSMTHDDILTQVLWAFENRLLVKKEVDEGRQLSQELLNAYIEGVKAAMVEVLHTR